MLAEMVRRRLSEVSPPRIDWHDIVPYIRHLRGPIEHLVRDAGVDAACRVLSRALSRFGDVVVRAGSDVLPQHGHVAGLFKIMERRIVLTVHPDVLGFASTDDPSWDLLVRGMAQTLAHELTHAWQASRRPGHPGREQGSYYADDPEEVAAWAQDIVNEVGIQSIRFLFGRAGGRRRFDLALLRRMSGEFVEFEGYLQDAPRSVRQRITKRLLRTVADISGLE